MGFPFIAPLKKELKEKFKLRQDSLQKNLKALSMPFAMLSSGAVVTKRQSGKQIKEIIHKQTWPTTQDTYYGCVISNSSDVKNMYQYLRIQLTDIIHYFYHLPYYNLNLAKVYFHLL